MTRAEVIASMPNWPGPGNAEALEWVKTAADVPAYAYQKTDIAIADIEQQFTNDLDLRAKFETAKLAGNTYALAVGSMLTSSTSPIIPRLLWEAFLDARLAGTLSAGEITYLKVPGTGHKSPAAFNGYDLDRMKWLAAIVEARGV